MLVSNFFEDFKFLSVSLFLSELAVPVKLYYIDTLFLWLAENEEIINKNYIINRPSTNYTIKRSTTNYTINRSSINYYNNRRNNSLRRKESS